MTTREPVARTGTEADAVEAVDLSQPAQVIRRGGILRVDAADATKLFWIPLQHTCEIAVVPRVVDHLNDDGPLDVVGAHETE